MIATIVLAVALAGSADAPALVSTSWLQTHLADADVRLVYVGNSESYARG